MGKFCKSTKNIKEPWSVKLKAKAKRIRFVKQVNAKMYDSMSESEICDLKLTNKKRWFRLFVDRDVFDQNFDRIQHDFPQKFKQGSRSRICDRRNSDLWLNTKSSHKNDLMVNEAPTEHSQDGKTEEDKEVSYRVQVQNLFTKVAQRRSKVVCFDDDCNTDDDQIRYDQTKLRCELLKAVRDNVVGATDESPTETK